MTTGTPRHTWIDGVTPITSVKLNALEQDVADGLATANDAAPLPGAGRHPLTGMFHADGYGVVADLAAEDTAGIEANTTALTAAVAAADAVGGTVLLPAGVIHYNAGALTLDWCHLIGQQGASFDRTVATNTYGTTLAPHSTTADQAGITLNQSRRGTTLRGFSLDLRNLADGSTDDPFTRSQTKGIHVDGSWNYVLEHLHLTGTPSNAAAIYIDDGPSALGAFWGNLTDVFINEYTKVGMANGRVGPTVRTSEQKDQTARGLVCNGSAPSQVTAVTLVNTTTYRGAYFKNVDVLAALNFHSEDAPEHGVYIDGGRRFTFTGGFIERAGSEDPGGDSSSYRPLYAVNSPTEVSINGAALVGNGLDFTQWGAGFVLEGDHYGLPQYARRRRYGDLIIDGAGAGNLPRNADVRVQGPYSAATEYVPNTDTKIYGYKDAAVTSTWDPNGLYSNASANFTMPQDAEVGANGKFTVSYTLQFRTWGDLFVAGDYIDIKLVPASLTFPGGAATTLINRHQLTPGLTSQMVTGTFEFTVVESLNAYFNLYANTNRLEVMPGLADTVTGRGAIAFRQVA